MPPVMNDFIQLKNVLSRSYRIPKDKQELAFRDFLDTVLAMKIEMKTLPFFAIEAEKDDEIVIRYYLSIENNNPGSLPSGLHFDSYFGISPMAAIVLPGEFEAKSSEAYQALYDAIDGAGMIAVTPTFVFPSGDSSYQYAIMKIGYADKRWFQA